MLVMVRARASCSICRARARNSVGVSVHACESAHERGTEKPTQARSEDRELGPRERETIFETTAL